MSEWAGDERRKREVRADNRGPDHDLLIEIHTIVKGMDGAMHNHFENDKDDFEKIHKRINKLSWYAALGAGVIFALEFFKEKIFK